MKFSKKFMTDMNEILGNQDWGQYFCQESLDLFDIVFGDSEISYYDNLNSIKAHPSLSKKDKLQWIKTVTMLQTNIDAIKYGDRYERLSEYRIITPLSSQDFTDLNTAINALKIDMNVYYSTNINAGYFDYCQIVETDDGISMKHIDRFDNIEPNALIQVHSRSGKTNVVSVSELSKYLESLIEEDKITDADSWSIYQKIKDIDDGFAVYEKLQ
jgi:hypothetical protein